MGEILKKHITDLSSSNSEYKTALNSLIKYEIQCLLERLSSTGEEAVVITTSEGEECPSYLHSIKCERFIEENKNISLLHSQLVDYCKVDTLSLPQAPQQAVHPEAAKLAVDCKYDDELDEDKPIDVVDDSDDDDDMMETGLVWPGSNHITMPTKAPPSPHNHHVTLDTYGDEIVADVTKSKRHLETTSGINGDDVSPSKKISASYLNNYTWDEEKIDMVDHSGTGKSWTDSSCSSGRAKDETREENNREESVITSFYDYETDTCRSQIRTFNTMHRYDKHLNGNASDISMFAECNGLFGGGSEYRFSMTDAIIDDIQALDYSKSGPHQSTKTESKETNEIDLTTTTSVKKMSHSMSTDTMVDRNGDEPPLFKRQTSSVARKASYPFLTKELFSSGEAETMSSSMIEGPRLHTRTEMDDVSEGVPATVEEIGSEKSNSLLNDLYMPHVKTEPCEEGSEASDMQYISPSRLLRHTELPSSPMQLKFTCKTCGEVFKNRQYRDIHVKLHRNAHKFACTVCGIGFDVEEEYQSHQKMHCEPLLICQDCGYRCTREFRMKSHREICGSPSKIYKCPFCHKPFAAKRYMNIHMKSHDVRNVNPCPYCPNVYPLKNSLLKHMKKKHNVTKLE